MARKDYYAILGVSPAETPEGIRAAYRKAVQRTHPDHAGPEGKAAFQDVVEAHSVLSDPNRRREYDETLRPPVHQPSFEAFAAGPAQRAGAAVEITLTPREAAHGGVLSFSIPVHEVCPACDGTGNDWFFPCFYCGGEGVWTSAQPVSIRIPPSLYPGAVRDLLFRTPGIENRFVKVRIRVSTDSA